MVLSTAWAFDWAARILVITRVRARALRRRSSSDAPKCFLAFSYKSSTLIFLPLFAHVPGGTVLLPYGLTAVVGYEAEAGATRPWFVEVADYTNPLRSTLASDQDARQTASHTYFDLNFAVTFISSACLSRHLATSTLESGGETLPILLGLIMNSAPQSQPLLYGINRRKRHLDPVWHKGITECDSPL